MRNAAGGLLVAPLSISAPEGDVGSDLVAVPNPVIHSCQILDDARDVSGSRSSASEALKVGARMGYSRSKIVDADDHDRVIAFTEGQGVRIGTPPDGLGKMPEDSLEIVDSPDLPPLWEAFGAPARDDGHWVLPELSVELASPDAALHIGPQHVVLETAAIDLAAEPRRHRPAADADVARDVHGAGQGRSVPGRRRSGARVPAAQVGVRLTLHDEGNDDHAITCASAVLRIVS